MQNDAPSRTAAFDAMARQLGRLLPPPARLVEDPYGGAFLSPTAARLVDRSRLICALPGIKHRVLYLQVRTRVIEDALRAFVDRGGRQIVLLGAGYDCRALRLPELADANVFEIDHPATQAHKRRVLDDLGLHSPSTYVAWNFETRPMDDLPGELFAAGLDRTHPVFTIWEGVTMYLTEAAIDASLRAIHAWSCEGSVLAMNYFSMSRIAQPSLATRIVKAAVRTVGEPWTFGWRPDELPAYLEQRGFSLVRDVEIADAARELLPARYAAYVAEPGRRFALATSRAVPQRTALESGLSWTYWK